MTPDEWLLRIVRGDEIAADTLPTDVDAAVAAAHHHSLIPLAADGLAAYPELAGHPLVERIRALAVHHAALDLERERELRIIIHALEAAGAKPLVFKGAHLAYTCYERPDLRPRVDTDLLIDRSPAARGATHQALTALGYMTPPHVGGDLVMTQRSYVKRRQDRVVHAVDVHWRLANPQVFAEVLTHEELLRDSVSIPALGPAARGPSGFHALVIACVHRVAHHADGDSLIWLYDIDRLWRKVREVEGRAPSAVEGFITERGISQVCRASLRRTVTAFGTPVPTGFLADRPGGSREATARFLDGPRGSAESALDDLRATRSWRARIRLTREHLFPPADYMRQVYAPASRMPLVFLYLRRTIGGLTRSLRG